MINIPDKYREEFDRSADFAVNSGKFTVKELAEHLGVGELVASIMVGYMEKTELVTKGKLGEVRRARIGVDEWKRIGKKIENYIPVPEEIEEEKPLPEIERQKFGNKEIYVTESGVVLFEEEEVLVKYEDITEISVIRPKFLKKGAIIFSPEKEVKLHFKKKEKERAEKIAEILGNYLGVETTFS